MEGFYNLVKGFQMFSERRGYQHIKEKSITMLGFNY